MEKNKDNIEYIAVRLSYSKQEYKPSKRYLLSCDDCWYETSNEPLFIFPNDKLEVLKQQLIHHFIYKAGFVYKDGTEVVWDAFDKPIKKQEPKKKKGLTITIKI